MICRVFCSLFFAASSLAAQQFAPADVRGVLDTRELVAPSHAVFGDIDGDGDPDLAIGNRLFVNDRSGTFVFSDVTPASFEVLEAHLAKPMFVDVDGDGDLDLLRGLDELWLNDGQGDFVDVSETHLPISVGLAGAVGCGDLDGDGDVDLVFATAGGFGPFPVGSPERLYLNDGSGHFTDVSATHFNFEYASMALAVGDLDGDADLDIVMGIGGNGGDRILLNDGNAVFTEHTLSASGAFVCGSSMSLADVEGDGDLDILASYTLTASDIGPDPLPCRIWINDGSANFVDATDAQIQDVSFGDAQGMTIGDFDNSGSQDIVTDVLRTNDGSGMFTVVAGSKLSPGAVADIDGDGDLDVYGAGRIYRNQGNNVFEDVGNVWPEQPSLQWSLLDAESLWGYEFRADSPTSLAAFGHAAAIPVFDADGDGDLDVLAYYWGRGFLDRNLRVAINQGDDREFLNTPSISVPVSFSSHDVAIGDVDNDGDDDVVLSTFAPSHFYEGKTLLFLSDGAGGVVEAPTQMPTLSTSSSSIDLGDVDGDGDLDLVLGNGVEGAPERNSLFLNDGAGVFSDATMTHLPDLSFATPVVSLGDVDGDGDLDLVAADQGPRASQLFLNDGSGHFTAAEVPRLRRGGVLADVDEDGDLDVVVDSADGSGDGPIQIALNDGTGWFVVDAVRTGSTQGELLGVGDIDLDGDIDIATTAGWIYNRHRQIEVEGLAFAGSDYTLRFVGEPGYGSEARWFVSWVAFERASVVTPFGRLLLNPNAGFLLPPVYLDAGTSSADVSFVVPLATEFVGLDLHTQAVVVGADPVRVPPAFTNLVSDEVLVR